MRFIVRHMWLLRVLQYRIVICIDNHIVCKYSWVLYINKQIENIC